MCSLKLSDISWLPSVIWKMEKVNFGQQLEPASISTSKPSNAIHSVGVATITEAVVATASATTGDGESSVVVPVAPFRSKTYGSQRSRNQKRYVERALAVDSGRDVTTLKVLVIGDPGVGKTALINQYVGGKFLPNYRQTIGVDFFHKMVRLKNGHLVRLQLWDIAGQERQRKLFRVYYRDADGCCLVFDLTNPTTFSHVEEWKEELDRQCTQPNGDRIPCLLLGNKVDLLGDERSYGSRVEKMMQHEPFVGFRHVSARDGTNVTDSIEYLTDVMVSNCIQPRQRALSSGITFLHQGSTSSPSLSLTPERHVVEEIHETDSCCF